MAHFDAQLFASAVRNRRGDLSLRDVSALLDNVSPSTLSRIEAGEEPSLRTFFELCGWMRADPGEFVTVPIGKFADLERRVAALEMTIHSQENDCDQCDGTGLVPAMSETDGRDTTNYGIECPKCKGAGRYAGI